MRETRRQIRTSTADSPVFAKGARKRRGTHAGWQRLSDTKGDWPVL